MRSTITLLCLMSISLALSAQRPYRNYQTQTFQQQLLEANPELKQIIREAERRIVSFRAVDQSEIRTIPIVFHIVHQGNESPINAAQIQSQIDALNRDFILSQQAESAVDIQAIERNGFKAWRADDTNIRFCLSADKGIRYISSSQASWGIDEALATLSPPTEPQFYLNVWIANLADEVSGYALFPARSRAIDGIVIDADYFGTIGKEPPYNEGKTLTHLLGNYLGLYDLWSQEGCADDYLSDTPIHNAPNFRCPDHHHISTCNGENRPELYMNFMDNTDDACLSMFTYQQVNRMWKVLSTVRKELGEGFSACSPFAVDETVENRSSDDEILTSTAYELDLYPNPTKDQLQLYLKGDNDKRATLRIFDANGQQVLQRDIRSQATTQLNCSAFQNGIFIAQITIDGQIISRRFTILR